MVDILEIKELSKHFRAVLAVDGISLTVREAEILALVGPNGSGKTTLFNCVTGFLRPSAGRVIWNGIDITAWPSHRIARSGLVRTFQQPMLFGSITTMENVRVAAGVRGRSRSSGSRLPAKPAELLQFCGLEELARTPAASLSYGQRRRLGVAVALAAQPALLLLDEPAAGLNHEESIDLAELLRRARDAGVTLLVVDHDMPFLLPLSERVIVMNFGHVIAEGTPQDIQRNPQVVEAYLGEKFAASQSPSSAGGAAR